MAALGLGRNGFVAIRSTLDTILGRCCAGFDVAVNVDFVGEIFGYTLTRRLIVDLVAVGAFRA